MPSSSRPLLFLLVAGNLAAQERPAGVVSADVRAGRETLSNGAAPWSEQGVTLRYRHGARRGVGVSMERIERFGQRDERVTADLSLPLGPRLTLGVDGEASATHAVVARQGGGASLHLALGGGWGVQLRGGERRYTAARVRSAGATLERYWGQFLAAYSITPVQLADASPVVTHTARVARFFGDRASLTLLGSVGREAEVLAASGPLVVAVRSGGAWGVVPIAPHLAITAAAGITDHRGLFTRRHLSAGLRVSSW